jgi:uncharacterized protein YeaO (DUF488 family)
MIQLKRARDLADNSDGLRYLVDRLWPRGVKKTDLLLDDWIQEVAPSTALRRWFAHDPARWTEFQRRYFAELDEHAGVWKPIVQAARQGTVTLIYSAHDAEHNNAVALRSYLQQKLRAESHSGSARE